MSWRPEVLAIASLALAGCQGMPHCQSASAQLQRQQRYDAKLAELASANRELQTELDEAQAKIKALTAIERMLEGPSISRPEERTPGKVGTP